MMKIKMTLISLITAAAFIATAIVNAATIPFDPATDCHLLSNKKSILFVHASWCTWCKVFYMPSYRVLSSNTKYQDWKFYEAQDDDASEVCGTTITHFPMVFVNGQKTMQNIPKGSLQAYLDDTITKNTRTITAKL